MMAEKEYKFAHREHRYKHSSACEKNNTQLKTRLQKVYACKRTAITLVSENCSFQAYL